MNKTASFQQEGSRSWALALALGIGVSAVSMRGEPPKSAEPYPNERLTKSLITKSLTIIYFTCGMQVKVLE
jgi:hypothetical protein